MGSLAAASPQYLQANLCAVTLNKFGQSHNFLVTVQMLPEVLLVRQNSKDIIL
jgi:hypothetical protein